MKRKHFKKIITIILAIFLLFVSYNWLLVSYRPVNQIEDELVAQHNLENEYLNKLSSNSYTIEKPLIILNPYQVAPLTALIAFTSKENKEITVTVFGEDENSTFKKLYPANTTHFIPIYGLYPNQINQVEVSDGNTSIIHQIETEALPDDFILPLEKPIADKSKLDNPLYLVSPAASGQMAGYDVNGDVRWYINKSYSWDIKLLKNGHLLVGSDRLINSPYYTVGLSEIDLTGKIYREYLLPGGYHHDVFEMEDGNLLVATSDFKRHTVEDLVVLLDRNSGAILKTWDVALALPKDQGKSENWIDHDWFHNNSVYYDKFNDAIILSGRHQDAVISLDYQSGDLNWILGDPTNWDEALLPYFLKPLSVPFEYQWSQHAAKITEDGKLLLFDNGNNKSKLKDEYVSANDSYSRAVIYQFDQDNKTVEQVFQYGKERGSSYYSPYISEADELGQKHYLIHSGGIGEKDGQALNQPGVMEQNATLTSYTTELLDNQIIYELKLPSNYYRAEKLDIQDLNPLSFGSGERIGDFKVTTTSEQSIKFWTALRYLPKKYNLKLNLEPKRLVVSGSFQKGSEVYIILKQGKTEKIYQIHVTKTPYTAMCIGIFNQDSDDENIINLDYYINSIGLSGKYEIYLKVNHFLFNTSQYVEFN